MTGTLQKLFDFQHFAENKKLQALIDDTMSRNCSSNRNEIFEDDLEMLFAAGDVDYFNPEISESNDKPF